MVVCPSPNRQQLATQLDGLIISSNIPKHHKNIVNDFLTSGIIPTSSKNQMLSSQALYRCNLVDQLAATLSVTLPLQTKLTACKPSSVENIMKTNRMSRLIMDLNPWDRLILSMAKALENITDSAQMPQIFTTVPENMTMEQHIFTNSLKALWLSGSHLSLSRVHSGLFNIHLMAFMISWQSLVCTLITVSLSARFNHIFDVEQHRISNQG